MASFKDVLIRDSKAGDSRKHQTLPSVDDLKTNPSIHANLEELCDGEEDIPNIEEVEIPDCEKFENLFLIGKLLGESIPLKTIMSKTKADWTPSGEVQCVDMGNEFILIKFVNEMDCNHVFFNQPWFVQGQIFNLQRWRRDFDPFKEPIASAVTWVRLPSLPVELWGEPILRKLLKQIGKVIKIDIDSEEVSNGRFAKVCVQVDILKPLKMEIKYKKGNHIKTVLVDYENLTDICYGCGQQDHKFENHPLFPKSFSIKAEKRFSDSSLHKNFNAETNDSTQANENWVVIKPKRRQGPNLGKPAQGNVKDHIVGNQEKDTKGKEQGHPIEETASKPRKPLIRLKVSKVRKCPDGTITLTLEDLSQEKHTPLLVFNPHFIIFCGRFVLTIICILNVFSCLSGS